MRPLPDPSRTFSTVNRAPGAAPDRAPLESNPLPAMMPASRARTMTRDRPVTSDARGASSGSSFGNQFGGGGGGGKTGGGGSGGGSSCAPLDDPSDTIIANATNHRANIVLVLACIRALP